MEQNLEVLPRVQGGPNAPHQIGTETHLNTEGGSLQVAPDVGRGNPDTSTTGKYFRYTPGRRGYYSRSGETMDETGGSTVGHEGRKLKAWLREATM